MEFEILDGGLGAELELRGTDIPQGFDASMQESAAPAAWWSAAALRDAPAVVESVHRDYILAGAKYHTTNTFRTMRPSMGPEWEKWAREAVRLLRRLVEPPNKVCASIAPLGACYVVDSAPSELFPHFEELASVFVDEGADILLCETFCSEREVCAAVTAALKFDVPVWASITPSPSARVLRPKQLRKIASSVVALGVDKILVNCVPASLALPYVEAISDLGVPCGIYANAGGINEGIGWEAGGEEGARRYAELAKSWVEAGATIIGGCCGTRPLHIEHLSAMLK